MRSKRLCVVVAVVLAILFAAASAQAVRTWNTGTFPHYSPGLVFLGVWWGAPETCEFPTGQWTEWHASWKTDTEEQLWHWKEKVIVEVELDGKPVEFERWDYEAPGQWPDYIDYGEVYVLLQRPLPPGEHTVVLRWTLTEDHWDGWDWYWAGTVIEMQRILAVTERESYPLGIYPICEY